MVVYDSLLIDKDETNAKNGEDTAINQMQKTYALKFKKVTDKCLDAVDLQTYDELGSDGLFIATALIKARKKKVAEGGGLDVHTADSGGISVGAGELDSVVGEHQDVSVSVSSFEINLFA